MKGRLIELASALMTTLEPQHQTNPKSLRALLLCQIAGQPVRPKLKSSLSAIGGQLFCIRKASRISLTFLPIYGVFGGAFV